MQNTATLQGCRWQPTPCIIASIVTKAWKSVIKFHLAEKLLVISTILVNFWHKENDSTVQTSEIQPLRVLSSNINESNIQHFLQMEKNASFQYFVSIHQTTRHHITDDNNLLDHYYSLKSRSSEVNFISCLGNHCILFRRFREIPKICHICPSVLLPDCMEQLCSQRKDFHGILYLNIFRKYVEKIQVSLKSDKNNGYFAWSCLYIHDNILMNCLQNNCYRRKL